MKARAKAVRWDTPWIKARILSFPFSWWPLQLSPPIFINLFFSTRSFLPCLPLFIGITYYFLSYSIISVHQPKPWLFSEVEKGGRMWTWTLIFFFLFLAPEMFEQDLSTYSLESTLSHPVVPELSLQEASELPPFSGFSQLSLGDSQRSSVQELRCLESRSLIGGLAATLFCFWANTAINDSPGIKGRGQYSLCPKGFGCEPF